MPKADYKRYTRALGTFVCEKVEEGICVAEACKVYSDYLPNESTIYRWKKKYPDFKRDLDRAYQDFFYKKIDEIEMLSKEQIPAELNGKEASNWINQRRLRIDTLKFTLGKLAPKLVPDLKDVPHSQVAIALPTIHVINYHDIKEIEKKE